MALVGVEKVAKVLNVTVRRVNQLVHEGLPRRSRGQYDLAQCMMWYIRYLQGVVEKRETPSEGPDANLKAQRERLVRAQADREELELRKAREEVIPAEVVEREWLDVLSTVRQQILSGPGRIAHLLEGENRMMIKAKLDKQAREQLASIAKEIEHASVGATDREDSERGGGDIATPADAQGKRVGGKE